MKGSLLKWFFTSINVYVFTEQNLWPFLFFYCLSIRKIVIFDKLGYFVKWFQWLLRQRKGSIFLNFMFILIVFQQWHWVRTACTSRRIIECFIRDPEPRQCLAILETGRSYRSTGLLWCHQISYGWVRAFVCLLDSFKKAIVAL